MAMKSIQEEVFMQTKSHNEKMEIPDSIKRALCDPVTITTITTVDADGIPHTVLKNIRELANGNLSYIELLPMAKTQRNLLRNFWWGNKPISMGIYNHKLNVYVEILVRAKRFIVDGEVWQNALDWAWTKWPDADPEGVWELVPLEIDSLQVSDKLTTCFTQNPIGLSGIRYTGPRPTLSIE
jgi:hypothetical protein